MKQFILISFTVFSSLFAYADGVPIDQLKLVSEKFAVQPAQAGGGAIDLKSVFVKANLREDKPALTGDDETIPNVTTPGTYPNEYTSSSYPNEYTSASYPNEYTSSSYPNEYTSTSYPNEYTSTSYPNEYTATSYPNEYTATSYPNEYTSSSYPSEYTQGNAPGGDSEALSPKNAQAQERYKSLPMPLLILEAKTPSR